MLKIMNKIFALSTLIKTTKTSKNFLDILNLSVKDEHFEAISIMANFLI